MLDGTSFSQAVQRLLKTERLMPLGPGTPEEGAGRELRGLSVDDLFAPAPISDRTHAQACLAGLWLYFDCLDESHALSQDLHTPEGSYWHAIMHRREPDATTSKYWWRRVGAHPVLKRLAERAPALGYGYTSPADFVDFCERVRGSGSAGEDLARRVQLLEWQLLFTHCYGRANAGPG